MTRNDEVAAAAIGVFLSILTKDCGYTEADVLRALKREKLKKYLCVISGKPAPTAPSTEGPADV